MWKALIVGLAQLEGSTVDDEAEALMCLNAQPAAWVALADWEHSLLEAAFRISFHLLAGADVEPGRLLSSLEAFPMLDDPECFRPSAGLRSLLERAAFHNHEESAKLVLMLMNDAGTKLCIGQLLFPDLWERLGRQRLGLATSGHSLSSMRFIQMITVQILASELEIAAGVWVRNGAYLEQVVQQYSQPPFSSHALDLDVVLIQLYLARDPEALRPLINMFGGRQLLLMADAALHWIGDQGAVINCPEPPTAVELDKGMEDDLRRFHWGHDVEAPQRMQCIAAGLTMLHKVLTIRNIWQSPKDKRQWLRHNVIHWLHLEPRTYSGLKGLLPDDHQLLKLLDTKVLPEVAEQHSRGSDAVHLYQLRPELRRELNCNFLYSKPQQIMSAEGIRNFQEAWACRPMPSEDPGSADELAFAAMQLLAVAVKPREDEGHVQFESSATMLLTGHAGKPGIVSCLETGEESSESKPKNKKLQQQEALMAQMKAQQAAFLQSQEEPEAMEEAADEAAVPSEAAGSSAPEAAGDVPSAAWAVSSAPLVPCEADCSVGIHVLCCGHLAHEQCLKSYRVGEAAAETRFNMLEVHEDLCPLCRRVVHCVLPGLTHAVTAKAAGLLSAQPAPSLEQLEAHLRAVLRVTDRGTGRWLHPETATLPLRPASAQQKRAAVHGLEKQLVLRDCLAQHRRMHSYTRSLQCQSELQRPQDIDLHGHASLAAALQRATRSEPRLEEVASSVAERVLDSGRQEPPAAAFAEAAQRHQMLIERGQGVGLDPGLGSLPSLQPAAWAVDMAGRNPQAPTWHAAAMLARGSSHCDMWASLAHGVVHWEAAHRCSIGPGERFSMQPHILVPSADDRRCCSTAFIKPLGRPHTPPYSLLTAGAAERQTGPGVIDDGAVEAAKASWRGLQALAMPAMALGTGERRQGPLTSEMAVEMVGYLLGSSKVESLQRVARQHLQPDVGPCLLTNMAPHMRGVPAPRSATGEEARQAFLRARGCWPPADTQVQRLTGDPFALFLLLAAVGCDSAVSQLVVMVALTQSVVLLHGVGCLGDQLLPWACSAPATSVTSDGGPGPCEELMEEAMGRLQPLLNRMLVVRNLMLGQPPPVQQLPIHTTATAHTCQNNKACALVISQSRASTVVNLYLDAHAEPDLMLRRGRYDLCLLAFMSELPPSEEPGLQVGKVCLHVSPHAFNGKTPLCLQSHDELLKDNEELHADVTVRSSILICEHRHVRCVDVYIAALPLQELENLLADAQAEIEQLRGRLDDQEEAVGRRQTVNDLRQQIQDLRRQLDNERSRAERAEFEHEDAMDQNDMLNKRVRKLEDDVAAAREEEDRMGARLRTAEEEAAQLHLEREESLRSLQQRAGADSELLATVKQQDWKIERLARENRALEEADLKLRARAEELQAENTDVSAKLVALHAEGQAHKTLVAELRDRCDQLAAERSDLEAQNQALQGEVADKMQLLAEFEARFTSQYQSWTAEKGALEVQLQSLGDTAQRMSARMQGSAAASMVPSSASEASDEAPEVTVSRLRDDLQHANEKELLLLEAYETLEGDVGKQVDQALARQAEQLERTAQQARIAEEELAAARVKCRQLNSQVAEATSGRQDAEARCAKYEAGVYGLPEAAAEISDLKQQLCDLDTQRAGKCTMQAECSSANPAADMVAEMNALGSKLEDLVDENRLLRSKAGLQDDEAVDLSDVKLIKETKIAQLQGITSALELEIGQMEEERRKLKWELKFRAKYHGTAALELGLTPEQLMLLERYADGLRHGGSSAPPEAEVVEQLGRRIQFLESRLAQSQAYASMPAGMRPSLVDSSVDAASVGKPASSLKICRRTTQEAALAQKLTRSASTSTDLSGLQTQLQEVLREVRRLAEQPNSAGAAGQTLAQQVTGLNADLIVKDKELRQVRREKARLAQQLRQLQAGLSAPVLEHEQLAKALPGQTEGRQPDAGAGNGKPDVVPVEDFEEMQSRLQRAERQVSRLMEEVQAAEEAARGAADHSGAACQSMLAVLSRQPASHAEEAAEGQAERQSLLAQVASLEEECQDARLKCGELEAALDALGADAGPDSLAAKYADTVRRQALVRHARLARQLAAATASEQALQAQQGEVAAEMTEVHATFCSRMQAAERGQSQLKRRLQKALRALDYSVPAQDYDVLVEKHVALARKLREHLEVQAEPAEDSAKAQMQHALATAVTDAFTLAGKLAAAEEKLRRAEAAERDRARSEARAQEVQDHLRSLEQQLGAAAKQLHAVREAHRMLELRFEGGCTRQDAEQLHEQLAEAEQGSFEAQALLDSAQQRLTQSDLQLKAARIGQQAAEAEAVQLRTALRELRTQSDAAWDHGRGHADLAQARAKEAMTRSALHRSKAECLSLRQETVRQGSTIVKLQAQAAGLHEQLRAMSGQRAAAAAVLDSALAGRVEPWQAHLWVRKLQDLREANAGLTSALQKALDAAAAAQTAEDQALVRLQHVAPSDKAGGDRQSLLELRLDRARATRQEVLLRERVHSLQGTCARLEGRLQEVEAEALGQHTAAAAERQQVAARAAAAEAALQELQQQHDAQTRHLDEVESQRVAGDALPGCGALHRLQWHRRSGRSRASSRSSSSGARAMRDTERQVLLAQASGRTATSGPAGTIKKLVEVEQLRQARLEAQSAREQLAELQRQAAIRAAADERLQDENAQLLARLQEQGQLEFERAGSSEAAMPSSDAAVLAQVLEIDISSTADLQANLAAGDLASMTLLNCAWIQAACVSAEVARTPLLSCRPDRLRAPRVDGSKVQEMARSTIADLQHKLAARAADLEVLQQHLQDTRAGAAAQAAADRVQLEQLTQQLHDKEASAIQQLRAAMHAHEGQPGPAVGDAGGLRQLQGLLDECKAERDALHSRLQQAQLLRLSVAVSPRFAAAAKPSDCLIHYAKHEAQLHALTEELGEREREISAARAEARRLALQLATKDRKLVALRDAIHALEGRLMEALKRTGDRREEGRSQREQQLEMQIAALQAEASKGCCHASRLAAGSTDLGATSTALAELQQRLDAALAAAEEKERHLQGMQSLLEGEERAVRELRQQLQAERAQATQLTSDVPDLRRQLQRLKAQNTSLKQQVGEQQAHIEHLGAAPPRKATASPRRAQSPARAGTPPGSTLGRSVQGEAGRHAGQPEGDTATGGRLPLQPVQAQAALLERVPDAPGGQSLLAGNPKLEAWEEQKKLHKRINVLRAKLRERSLEAEQLQREREQRAKQAAQAQGELARQATIIQQLQVQLRRARDAPAGSISAAQVTPSAHHNAYTNLCMSSSSAMLRCHQEEAQTLVQDLARTEERVAYLEQELARAQARAAGPAAEQAPADPAAAPSRQDQLLLKASGQKDGQPGLWPYCPAASGGLQHAHLLFPDSDESQLLELRLERDQAAARACRLQLRMECILGQAGAADETVAATLAGAAAAGAGTEASHATAARQLPRGKAAAPGLTQREGQLVATVEALQRALEKQRHEAAGSAVDKRKELAKRCAALEAEAQTQAGLQGEVQRLEQRCQQLQAANDVLRRQVRAAVSQEQKFKALQEQVSHMEHSAETRSVELLTLRRALAQRDAQIAEVGLSQQHGQTQEQELTDLRGELAALQLENEDLKKELNAFEPAFFEEIEDLKFQHLQLQKHCAALESQLSGT
eukprot:jgi/Astpho2/6915/Aster-01782